MLHKLLDKSEGTHYSGIRPWYGVPTRAENTVSMCVHVWHSVGSEQTRFSCRTKDSLSLRSMEAPVAGPPPPPPSNISIPGVHVIIGTQSEAAAGSSRSLLGRIFSKKVPAREQVRGRDVRVPCAVMRILCVSLPSVC